MCSLQHVKSSCNWRSLFEPSSLKRVAIFEQSRLVCFFFRCTTDLTLSDAVFEDFCCNFHLSLVVRLCDSQAGSTGFETLQDPKLFMHLFFEPKRPFRAQNSPSGFSALCNFHSKFYVLHFSIRKTTPSVVLMTVLRGIH